MADVFGVFFLIITALRYIFYYYPHCTYWKTLAWEVEKSDIMRSLYSRRKIWLKSVSFQNLQYLSFHFDKFIIKRDKLLKDFLFKPVWIYFLLGNLWWLNKWSVKNIFILLDSHYNLYSGLYSEIFYCNSYSG